MTKVPTKDEEFYLPATREERRTLLKQYISTKLTQEWLRLPKERANMERRFLRRLIETI